MAGWIRVGQGMRTAAHTAFLGTLTGACAFSAVSIYCTGVETIPVSTRHPVLASEASRRLQPSYLSNLPIADSFEYPVPLQWLEQLPDATQLSRSFWLSWAFKAEMRALRWFALAGSSVKTHEEVERDPVEPGTSFFGVFDVLEKARDGSCVVFRIGRGPDPRDFDGVMRLTVEIEDDLAVFGYSSAVWSATTPDRPTWLTHQFHKLYAKVLLKAAVQRMLRPQEERQKFVNVMPRSL